MDALQASAERAEQCSSITRAAPSQPACSHRRPGQACSRSGMAQTCLGCAQTCRGRHRRGRAVGATPGAAAAVLCARGRRAGWELPVVGTPTGHSATVLPVQLEEKQRARHLLVFEGGRMVGFPLVPRHTTW